MNKPLILLTLAYILGLIFGHYFSIPSHQFFIPIILTFILCLISFFMKKTRICTFLQIFTIILIGVLFYRLSIVENLPSHHITHFANGEKVTIEGTLYQSPERLIDRVYLYIKADKLKDKEGAKLVTGKVRITLYEPETTLKYGDTIRIKVKLRRPRGFHNTGGFEYERYMAKKGIYAVGGFKSDKLILRLGEGKKSLFLAKIYDLKNKVSVFFDESLPKPQSNILKVMVLGERGVLAENVKEMFQRSGVSHLLAISGLHIGFIAFLFFYLMKKMLLQSEKLTLLLNISKVSAGMTIIPVIFYTIIAGGRASTVRACIMVITYLLAVILDREEDLYNTLALAALIILLWEPTALFDIGFQLSFISVWAIIYVVINFIQKRAKILSPIERIKPKSFFDKHPWMLSYIAVAVTASIATAPLVAYYFNYISTVGIVTNLLVVPLVGFIIVPLGLVSALLSLIFGPLAMLLLKINELGLTLLYQIIKYFSSLSFASIRVTTPSLSFIITYFIFIMALINLKRKKWSKYGLALAVLLFIFSFGADHLLLYRNHELMTVTFIDIGQGDSALIEFPNEQTMLIDGGGIYGSKFDIGKNVVGPFLWDKGIKKLDYVVLTHSHPDHLNGLVFILREFEVGQVWDIGLNDYTEAYLEFIDLIKKKNIPYKIINSNSKIANISKVQIFPFNPIKGLEDNRNIQGINLNNVSMVLKMVYNDIAFLFSADIETETEEAITKQYGDFLKSEIIKVPHHGGRTSSTERFLDYVQPEIAVISVGENNRFNHPSDETLKRYENLNTKVYRTDRDGAIVITTDGKEYEVKTNCVRVGELRD